MDESKKMVAITDLYPVRAQYRSGETATLAVELANVSGEAATARVRCVIRKLDAIVEVLEREVVVPANGTAALRLEAGPFAVDYAGFGVDAELLAGDGKRSGALAGMVPGRGSDVAVGASRASTAFDVVSDWSRALRYGFLSDFDGAEAGDMEDVKWMAKLHLNLVQFYDWMYRHDDLVSDEETYTDLMGRSVSRSVVEEKISLCHEHGMKAMAYGAVYAASKPVAERHPDWRLYTGSGEPYDFIGIFNIMNISRDCPWHDHIVGEYRKAVEKLDFDGIHMDTYGFPKTGWSRLDGEPRRERLTEQFPALIESTREALAPIKDEICLVFNNVGNWPVDTVARSSQDAIYVEVWKPYERYHHLREIIAWAQSLSGGKNVILAAYLKPFREVGPLGEDGAENGFRLLNAVVTAHGASHLLHGENGGVLTQGYYVDHSKLRPGFLRTVRDYADFGVRYGHVLNAPGLRDVSMTHADGDNLEYAFEGFAYSTYGEAGKTWTIVREREGMSQIHFVNLASATDDRWNEAKERPAPVTGRIVRIEVDDAPSSILLASPDANGGQAVAVDYRVETTDRGMVAVLELPPLLFWDMLIVRSGTFAD
ncbi:glycoside hydrolase family 66 protein [Paenibacillus sp. LHD-117]|uniref:glycoside hydrolase family 66 protein n=1 Tax=Paenibacillus sp. LHD-117 TaxID=3071412 RepID=UPI0027DEE3EF|nr:glycoside hydrolase family 66 protein [Paenibacillus sp. LHD-117]MDQ6421509.1 glycoside hydrolase family 66 protein [Paenibacillus sp. LHD-117]